MEMILYFVMYMVGVALGAYCITVLYRSLLVQKWKTSSIIIYHSAKQKTRRVEDRLISSKKNKETHGYGMQIIERIAKKYGGSMQMEYRDTKFINKIVMEEI